MSSLIPAARPQPGTTVVDPGWATGEVDRLRLVLLRLARRIRTNSSGHITPSQLAVLATIVRNERLTVGQIAEYEHVKPPSASKIVGALEHKGLVERRTDPSDRRCAHIAATPDGIAHLDGVRAAGRTWLASQLEMLDDDQLATLETALPALEQLLGRGE
jgi:DNA-binding MarR family transcriptional regulator